VGARLEGLNPLAVLARGYSVTRELPGGGVLTSAEGIAPGTVIESILARGLLRSRVEEVESRNPFEGLGAEAEGSQSRAEGANGQKENL